MKIGLDGGGSKTVGILVDDGGGIVSEQRTRGCSPSLQSSAEIHQTLDPLLARLRGSAHQAGATITHTVLCMAGSPLFWREWAAALTDCGAVQTCDDSIPVLELATAGRPGLVLHAGTGSFVAARAPAGAIHYIGGLGWKLGDPGSGYDLGRRAIALALLELKSDPGAPPSALVKALCAHTGLPDYPANSHLLYNDPAANAVIAGFAPRVIELAAADCGPAQQVLADSITELARQADQVIHRLFPSSAAVPKARIPLGISGRILNSAPAAFVVRSLASKLNWPVELRFIDTAPIEGVRRLLLALR